MLPERFLNDLKLKVDIENIISPYVNLKMRGSSLVGLCPFHSEKTPSFTVFPDTQSYYCFGCGAGGDAITFVRQIENLEYIEAVKFLAEKVGLTVPDEGGRREERIDRERIYEMNRTAARFFHEQLKRSGVALQYLEKRQLAVKTVKRFGLGYAPDSWDSLLKELRAKGYRDEEIRNAGLCVRNKNGHFYDYFRGRLMVPILDVRGRVVAFGGRVLDDSQPKYLNSPDTPVFKKSNTLFNLNNAKSQSVGRLILAEGYMDVISMSQWGFTEAVATLGTAITDAQARMLTRYSAGGEVVIAYDSDEAGQKATNKAITLLEAAGAKVRVLRLPDGKDPDEFLKKHGPERFKLVLAGSGNQIEYKLANAKARHDVESPDGKVSYLKDVVGILAATSNAIARDVYAGRAAQELGVSKESILQEVTRARRAYEKRRRAEGVKAQSQRIFAVRDRINPQKAEAIKAARAEEGILCILFFSPEYLDYIEQHISEADFVTEFNRRIYHTIVEIIREGGVPDMALFGEEYSPEEMGAVAGILAKRALFVGAEEQRHAVDDFIAAIRDEKYALQPKEAGTYASEEIDSYLKNLSAKKKRNG